ncbi:MAG: hypothetical protein ACTS6H_01230 [Candidatus Hodgkinia cicadicola]
MNFEREVVLNFQININEGGGFANFVEWAAYFQVRSCMLRSLNVLVRNGNLIWSEVNGGQVEVTFGPFNWNLLEWKAEREINVGTLGRELLVSSWDSAGAERRLEEDAQAGEISEVRCESAND